MMTMKIPNNVVDSLAFKIGLFTHTLNIKLFYFHRETSLPTHVPFCSTWLSQQYQIGSPELKYIVQIDKHISARI